MIKNIEIKKYLCASKEELAFIKDNMPRGMISMIKIKTGETKRKIEYQIKDNPKVQNPKIIDAAREILKAVKGLSYENRI